jgi:Fe-S cluster assembly iron-binding protein IscA
MPAITVSEAAAARIAKILTKEPGKSALRVSVEGGGCSGFSYKFDLAEGAD